MKHFGALLTGQNNTVDGGEDSRLVVGTASSNNDAIIIHNEAPAIITAAKTLTDSGLVLVPYNTVTYDSTSGAPSHILGADGREVAVSDLVVQQDFSAIGTIPVSADADNNLTGSGTVTQFIDSALSQTGSGAGSTVTAAGNFTITGNLTVSGDRTILNTAQSVTEDKYIVVNTVATADGTEPVAATQDGGLLVRRAINTNQASNDPSTPNSLGTHAGIRFNEGSGAWEVSAATTTGGGVDADWTELGLSTSGVTQITPGPGLQGSDSDTTLGSDPVDGSTVLRVNVTALGVASADGTTPGGGLTLDGAAGNTQTLGIDNGGITAGQLAHDIANTRTGLANGTAGQAILSQGNGGFEWGTVGTVSKHIAEYSKGTTTTFIRVAQTDHGLPAANSATDDTAELYTVQVYETSTGYHQQIIPENIFVASAAVAAGGLFTGSPSVVAGDVVVQFGTTVAVLAGRIVIKA